MNIQLHEQRQQGFFSCFNLVLNGLNKLRNNGENNIYVIWNNSLYQSNSYNLFDKIFWKQKQVIENYDQIYSAYDLMYDDGINKKMKQKGKNETLFETLEKNNFFQNEMYIKCLEKAVKNKNTLGVHVRKTDSTYHRRNKEIIDEEYYYEKINKIIDNYEKLFIATDDKDSLKKFKYKFGSKLIYNEDINRVTGSVGIHNYGFKDKEKLAEDVFIDALSLQSCKKIIGVNSNIRTFVNIINPKANYERIDMNIEYH